MYKVYKTTDGFCCGAWCGSNHNRHAAWASPTDGELAELDVLFLWSSPPLDTDGPVAALRRSAAARAQLLLARALARARLQRSAARQ
ncbi:MAG: hypothetical protein VX670_11985 [Candidatus Latescibacterota bacterium]|nr:hypothetical protein [Candidatus Latescibacterota bacterium]